MNLSDRDIDLVTTGLERAERASLFSDSGQFYKTLFEIEPSFRGMFRDDLTGQGMKFMTTLRTIVRALKDPDDLYDKLKTLGETHGVLGVAPEHYAPMGEALIQMFQRLLKDDFTPEMEEAWRAAYKEISRQMIDASKQA